MANPVTALGRNFLTAPEAFAELIRLFRPSTRLKRADKSCSDQNILQNILGQMLGVILEAGGVQLSEGQQIYHRLSGVSSALKPGDKISCEDTKVTMHDNEFWGRN